MGPYQELTWRQGVIWGVMVAAFGLAIMWLGATVEWLEYWYLGPVPLHGIVIVTGVIIAVRGGYVALAAEDPRARRSVPIPELLRWLVHRVDRALPGASRPVVAGARAKRARRRVEAARGDSTVRALKPRPRAAARRQSAPRPVVRVPGLSPAELTADATDVRDYFVQSKAPR